MPGSNNDAIPDLQFGDVDWNQVEKETADTTSVTTQFLRMPGLLGGGNPKRVDLILANAKKVNQDRGVPMKSSMHPIHNLPPDSPTTSTAAMNSYTGSLPTSPAPSLPSFLNSSLENGAGN